jgi:hypothetical protein
MSSNPVQKVLRRKVSDFDRPFIQAEAERLGVPAGLQPRELGRDLLEWSWIETEDDTGPTRHVHLVDGPCEGQTRAVEADLLQVGARVRFFDLATLNALDADVEPAEVLPDPFPIYRLDRRGDGAWIGRRTA